MWLIRPTGLQKVKQQEDAPYWGKNNRIKTKLKKNRERINSVAQKSITGSYWICLPVTESMKFLEYFRNINTVFHWALGPKYYTCHCPT